MSEREQMPDAQAAGLRRLLDEHGSAEVIYEPPVVCVGVGLSHGEVTGPYFVIDAEGNRFHVNDMIRDALAGGTMRYDDLTERLAEKGVPAPPMARAVLQMKATGDVKEARGGVRLG